MSVLCQEVKGLQEAPIPAVAVSMLKCLIDVRDLSGSLACRGKINRAKLSLDLG